MKQTYITNVRTVVRVDGVCRTVEPSTHLPNGVAEAEIERLLRFSVIRVAASAPTLTSAKTTVKRASKKTTTDESSTTEE
ncbi:hypothetical protein [Microbacterium karelineae]|uniref:hypothetical protein n=1 Tax=Microbacterium karelineae TaxID=2654283 RepID=UPI0012EA2423|nr:hypothetical protein [Microbacterium karelineae]